MLLDAVKDLTYYETIFASERVEALMCTMGI